jgi:hypothetical protein
MSGVFIKNGVIEFNLLAFIYWLHGYASTLDIIETDRDRGGLFIIVPSIISVGLCLFDDLLA